MTTFDDVPETVPGDIGAQPLDLAANPFALMTHPQAVLQAVQLSDRLASLQSRVYRPLDQTPARHPGDLAADPTIA
ncbi:hypothetical protein IS481_01825 [Caldimonas thermodepolymerans]|jgi:hypothetical protein|uniref:Uncharacterized protein n=1 Tax=Caldimonas thermodepolymerans TaxID=215580 RepID=A0A2S5T3S7_9BURK|nr:hypothetical protein [Caldimonas thermodepolymerans]PPE69641.1 hypothetical protein C1702_10615 [Caldimonas thermodepolymerans]QPC31949.1 hypothetical protein IS481_01825 [Caldimonas thermodepolymerans]RDI01531.1 hypothetical protein DES46_10394 [Caldimonas thermodepolymerans]TCP05021.1 hypothetical protein EV676_109107 [Caldimonas thermodepolymerans]UZG44738.1 hypothetical protein ONZ46_01970 [Caldimonas thermodepolymerans]